MVHQPLDLSLHLLVAGKQEGDFLSGRGVGLGLVEANVGYIGGFDGVCIVVLLF